MKTNPLLPVFLASSVGLAQVLGPHEAHIEPSLQEQGPQLVGMLATFNVVSTATATVMSPSALFGWRDFQ